MSRHQHWQWSPPLEEKTQELTQFIKTHFQLELESDEAYLLHLDYTRRGYTYPFDEVYVANTLYHNGYLDK